MSIESTIFLVGLVTVFESIGLRILRRNSHIFCVSKREWSHANVAYAIVGQGNVLASLHPSLNLLLVHSKC